MYERCSYYTLHTNDSLPPTFSHQFIICVCAFFSFARLCFLVLSVFGPLLFVWHLIFFQTVSFLVLLLIFVPFPVSPFFGDFTRAERKQYLPAEAKRYSKTSTDDYLFSTVHNVKSISFSYFTVFSILFESFFNSIPFFNSFTLTLFASSSLEHQKANLIPLIIKFCGHTLDIFGDSLCSLCIQI